MDQSPVHLYDPITDYVSAELKRRCVVKYAGWCSYDGNRIPGSTSILQPIRFKSGLGLSI